MDDETKLARDDSATEELLTSVAQRMADSEKKIRDRALRNIRRWLTRNGEGSPFARDDVAKLWRALFVCMWMSDKPLVQEQLTDSISALSAHFKNDDAAMLFLEEFFVVMAVKWNGIDKWRFDKFLMLVRKMVRQIFVRGAEGGWKSPFVSKLATVMRATICKIEAAHLAQTPLGLKLHVADLFCEELAKVGINDHLTTDVVIELLRPYMEVVQKSRDPRFVIAVVKRVFDYLLKQSDAVIKHDVEASFGVSVDDEEDDEEMEDEEDGDVPTSKILDPRAGGVCVDVPQIPVDYNKFHEVFFELAGSSDLRQKTRNMLYSLVKKFKDVASGVYPFPDYKALDPNDFKRLGKQDYDEAVKRLQEFEKEIYVDSSKNYTKTQKRKDRKALKRLERATKGPLQVKSDSTLEKVPDKRKRVDKYAKIRGGRKGSKLSKIGKRRSSSAKS